MGVHEAAGWVGGGAVVGEGCFHDVPFTLVLDGPAGGTFTQGGGGKEIHLDAIEFCRLVSGRGQGGGLLTRQIPF
jgi:hypothetical protein